ncbi:hypothetical protein MPTP_0395 [Melissococcus plutonius ATCC 35311]|uniref:Uncharacterized protein n=1 Tax=Melissococcus plutonius (strain ATCC 35311 / DSM 29964 / CIP 104052 / LMG 20360 / NCIMB 702443) TaxID=940190 RepID=F3Y8P9_MELPT|nr:hypothetical protein MPTP_0395 [Melissococcus plutonius ATCC 35311]
MEKFKQNNVNRMYYSLKDGLFLTIEIISISSIKLFPIAL